MCVFLDLRVCVSVCVTVLPPPPGDEAALSLLKPAGVLGAAQPLAAWSSEDSDLSQTVGAQSRNPDSSQGRTHTCVRAHKHRPTHSQTLTSFWLFMFMRLTVNLYMQTDDGEEGR